MTEKYDDVLESTPHYIMVVGDSVHSDKADMECYQIINRTTWVVEVETTIYPRALDLLRNIEQEYERALAGDVEDSPGNTELDEVAKDRLN